MLSRISRTISGRTSARARAQPVADDLGQFFAGLREDSSHRVLLVPLTGNFALLARFFDDGDEDVFEREALFAGARRRECRRLQVSAVLVACRRRHPRR